MKNSLLDKFNAHMILFRFSPKTQKAYLHAVKGLSDFYRKSPDQLSDEQIQGYLIYLIKDRKLAWSSCNVVFSGLRLFYLKIVKWDETRFTIPPRGRQKHLPTVLSRDEVQRLIDAAKNIKHRVFLMTVYSAGLRVSEAVHLKPCHIESSRMMIRVEQGKGRKDRYTLLAKTLLQELRNYWRSYRPNQWLFFAQDKNSPMPVGTAQKIYYNAKQQAGITKGRGIHTLRHSFATHLLDQGVDIYTIKRFLGHTSLSTTFIYLHLTQEKIRTVVSPLDRLEEIRGECHDDK